MLPQIIANGLAAGFAYALLAMGFGLWYSTAKFLNIAYLVPFLVSPYAAYLCVEANIAFIPALIFGILIGVISGAILELGVFSPMRKRGATPLILLLASVGVYVVLQSVLSIVFGDAPKDLRLGFSEPTLRFASASLTRIQLITIGTSAAAIVICELFLRLSKAGKLIRAVAADSEMAQAVGIDYETVKLLAATISALFAGACGLLFAYDTGLVPSMGFRLFLMGITAMVIGGLGSNGSSLLGGLFVGLAQHLGVWKLPSQWQDAIVFIILTAFLILRPQGFLGRPLRMATI